MNGICEVIIEADVWDRQELPELSEVAARAVLAHFGCAPGGYLVSVLGCDDAKISSLNSDFRDKANATNVLSWPSEDRVPGEMPEPGSQDDPCELGDIAISFETCDREARDQNKGFADHVVHLLVHAMLHLLGYDHQEETQAQLMEGTEIAILGTLGIKDPYV